MIVTNKRLGLLALAAIPPLSGADGGVLLDT